MIERTIREKDYLNYRDEEFALPNARQLSMHDDMNHLFSISSARRVPRESYSRYLSFMRIVTDVLNDFGIHISNNGYSYIIDSVMVILDLQSRDVRLNNDVYPNVARKYNFSKYTIIEHNIRNAIKSAYRDNEIKPGINKMGIFRKRPTNKRFLLYVADIVSRKMYEEMLTIAG